MKNCKPSLTVGIDDDTLLAYNALLAHVIRQALVDAMRGESQAQRREAAAWLSHVCGWKVSGGVVHCWGRQYVLTAPRRGAVLYLSEVKDA